MLDDMAALPHLYMHFSHEWVQQQADADDNPSLTLGGSVAAKLHWDG